MKKSEALARWRDLKPGMDPLVHMTPIPPKTSGSRYGACGIRIDGTPQFIDAVLSCLKTLLDGENQVTRLELVRNSVKPALGRSFENAAANAEVCYIRLHLRTAEGAAASAFFDRGLTGATERYAKRLGLNPEQGKEVR